MDYGFPYEVWADGAYVNAYDGRIAAIAKAELLRLDGRKATVYEWIPARHVRRPVWIDGADVGR